jgi:hypothetical protein
MHGLPVQRPLQPSTKPARRTPHAVAGIRPVDRRRSARPSSSPHVIVDIVPLLRSSSPSGYALNDGGMAS